MSLKKDLSIDFLGVKCENPFFLSSSPVGSNYEMCAKALELDGVEFIIKQLVSLSQTSVLLVLISLQKKELLGSVSRIWSRFLTSH